MMLESAPFGGGRLAYGSFTTPAYSGGAAAGSVETANRFRFTGKEDQNVEFGVPYTDFGARQYSPVLRRWTTQDPLSEKYYDVSPYVYCAGDPVNLVDVKGESMTDFFNEYGVFIYSDNQDNGIIRIASDAFLKMAQELFSSSEEVASIGKYT